MSKRPLPSLLFGLVLVLPAAPLHAEVLNLPPDTGDESGDWVKMPARGMTMKKVRMWFGEPVKQYPAVGDPPITRWEYPGYIVYFEYDRVIEAVRKHHPNPPK